MLEENLRIAEVRTMSDVAAPETPSQRPGWLMALTWDMVRYCADKHQTTRVSLEEFWLKRRNMQTTCMTFRSATKTIRSARSSRV